MDVYQKIYDMLMSNMMNFGIIKTITISSDYYSQLSEDQIYYLSGMMECSSQIRWVVNTEETKHINFIYSQYPIRKPKDEETVNN